MNKTFSPRRRARGFTLIEVLISILIFSFGILGAVGMQARLQQASVQNGDRARASMLADEMAAMMWAHGSVNIPSIDSSFYTAWQSHVASPSTSGLPSGAGTVALDSTGKVATIKITWTPTSQASSSTFKTTVVIP